MLEILLPWSLTAETIHIGTPEELSPIIASHLAHAKDSIVGLSSSEVDLEFCRSLQTSVEKGLVISLFLVPSIESSPCHLPLELPHEDFRWAQREKSSGATLSGSFFILDDQTVLFQSEIWETRQGLTKTALLVVSDDPHTIGTFRKTLQNMKKGGKMKAENGGNWSIGPLRLTINNQAIQENPIELRLGKKGETDFFLRVWQQENSPWKKVTLILESDPPLQFIDKSARSNKKTKRNPSKLIASPISLFGPLRKNKPWVVMTAIKEAKPQKYRWRYRVESNQGVATGGFTVLLKKRE